MVDLDVLNSMGSSQARLKEIFTAQPPDPSLGPEEAAKAQEDLKLRNRLEEDIWQRFAQQINYSLRNYEMYSAVDLAWDAAPINKFTVPLLLYAQGRLDVGACAKVVGGIPGHEQYTTKDQKGSITKINVPKFFEVNFNLIRSVITRRLAAQANKYLSLHPYYKYEPRSTSMVGKLRADVLSQVMDIMTDQFDLRHHDVQVLRDAMLYGHSVDFVRASWERYHQIIPDPDVNPEFIDKEKPPLKTVIEKEGVGWINPHPTRVFWDNNYPLSSINSDSGCEFIGFWDVTRYGDIAENPKYWNRKNISYSTAMFQLFATYAQYFTQYLCTITPPCDLDSVDLSAQNDRKNQLALYAQTNYESSMLLGYYFKKIVPSDWGIGRYPYPVWLRMLVAGSQTVVHAEFLPSTPACYLGVNENDSRQLNISIAMELMPYQDQLSQLLSLLMLTIQSSNFRVLAINKDLADADSVAKFRLDAEAKNKYPFAYVFEYSQAKMEQALPGFNIKSFIELIETSPGNAVTVIFQAIGQLVQLAERLMALSPNELGQPAPREISANESNLIAATTETIYGFISNANDEFRAAKKRILYESYMMCGSPEVRVPVINRYTKKTIEKAGFDVLDEDVESDVIVEPDKAVYHTVTGTKSKLFYNYVYTSRDGAQRPVNTEAANVLVQLINLLQNPMIAQAVGRERMYNIINEIFRLSGSGIDLKLELEENEPNALGVDKQAQVEQVLSQLASLSEQGQQVDQAQQQQIAQINAKLEELNSIIKELIAQVAEISRRAPDQMPDPMEMASKQQDMMIRAAEADQRLQSGELGLEHQRQRMMQGSEKHSLDMALKLMKPAKEGNGNA